MNKRLLLVFARTPQLGKVKTRLARTLGEHQALQIYKQLLHLTHAAAAPVKATKWICYSDEVPAEADIWSAGSFLPQEQPQVPDLGYRMHSLFAKGLVEGFSPVVIIGSDCPDISPEIIEEAFRQLETHDVVLGPAQDGGYYLLGLNFLVPELFTSIPWSTAEVLPATLQAASNLHLKVAQLQVLADVDEAEDLQQWPLLLHPVA
ncbi:hypothetical protein TH63_09955 [Rufibacter radiotolerans]|uniref:Glycosyltransferase n=1 Tax=Rufibacter radiotolerans TaxID=1379910 RepID=A0A0H4VKM6_9BACT|nr:TIGR04282 family arsenosugar biosynthesis glycosyltransferase [Rufibacter radiotolerans]AKQ45893.1 hypothetical protein TH63_09955 [Rufibacter radiotolerans]